MKIIFEEVRKMMKLAIAYPIEMVHWGITPLLWVLPFIFQGKALVGSLNSAAFERVTGTGQYISFVIIGAIVSTYMLSGVWGIGSALREETYYGTLEHIFCSPAPTLYILMGKVIFESLLSTMFVCTQLFICVVFFGIKLTLIKIAPILLFIVLLTGGMYGIGLAIAGLTLAIKESYGMVLTFSNILYFFSPIRYPVEIHPITRTISMFIPLTYALIALRGIMLDMQVNLWRNALILLIIDCVIVPLGIVIFYRMDKNTRHKGTLAHY